MMLGMGLPILLIAINEWILHRKKGESFDYKNYIANRNETLLHEIQPSIQEVLAIEHQNRFGMRVIAGSLAFTAFLMFGLSFFTVQAKTLIMSISGIILVLAMIPLYFQHKR